MLYFPALLLPTLAGSVMAGLPSQTCSVPQACEAHGDNLISAVAGVNTLAECKQLCRDVESCNLISHFGPDSLPLHSYCMMFINCSYLHDCPDCWSEDKVCFESCDSELEGEVFDNALEIITDVPDEPSCLLSCKKNPECQFFTYYSSRDLNYPGLCFLQRELSGSLTACEHCKTGISDCSDITDDICSFSVGSDDTPLTSFMFTESGTNITVTFNISDPAMLLCELNIVAVGGGGRLEGGYYGGGGSGYVSSINVSLNFLQLTVRVGWPGEKSTIGTPDQLFLSASSGGDSSDDLAGSGYSGGGYRADGGEDGGDGYGSRGGKGSGLDLSSITLQNFSLTPGVGGKAQGSIGGGGGGVLVNGVGPNRASTNSGEGYGGGRYYNSDTDGPGLVLMEIIRRK